MAHEGKANHQRNRGLHWLGRAATGAGKGLLWLLISIAALVGSLLLHLDSGPGRRAVCSVAQAQVSELLVGELQLEQCSSLRLGRLRIEGIRLHGADGEQVASLAAVEVRPDVGALLGGEIRVHEARLEGPRVSLVEREGELALVRAVALAEPTEPEPPEPEAEPTVVHIERIRLTSGSVTDLPDNMRVEGLELDVGLHLAEGVETDLRRLDAELLRGEQTVAHLGDTRGALRLLEDAKSELSTSLTSGEDGVELEASMRWGTEGPSHVEARAEVAVSPALLERFGQDEAAAQLRGPVAVDLHVEGPLDDLALDATIRTDGGEASLEARYAVDRIEATLDIPGLALGEVTTAAEGHVAGHVETTVTTLDEPAGARRIELGARDLRYDVWGLPELAVEAVVAEDHARVESLSLPHLTRGGGHLDVGGRVGFDGTADVRLDAHFPDLGRDRNLRRLAPEAGGSLRTDVRVELGDKGEIEASGMLALQDAVLPGARVQRLNVQGRAAGSLPAPRADLSIDGAGIEAGGETIESVSLTVKGGPPGYDLRGRAALARGPQAELDLRVTVGADRYGADGRITVEEVWPAPVVARLDGVVVRPSRGVEMRSVSLRGEGLSLGAQGEYRFTGPSDLQAELHTLDVATLAELLEVEQALSGQVDAEVRFRGTPRRPELDATVSVADAELAGVPLSSARLQARWSNRERRVSTELSAELGDYGSIRLDGRADLARRRDPVAALREGELDARLVTEGIDLRLAERFEGAPPVRGVLALDLTAKGSLAEPQVDLELRGRDVAAAGLPPLNASTKLSLHGEDASLTVGVEDGRGSLLSAHAEALVNAKALTEGADPMGVLAQPWSLSVHVPERRLDELPGPAAVELPMSARVDIELSGGAEPTRGDVDAVLAWEGALPEVASGCEDMERPGATLTARLRGGLTELEVHGTLDDREVLTATTELETPVDSWIERGPPTTLPPVGISMDVPGLALAHIPRVCEHATGTLKAQVRAEQLLTAHPHVTIELEAEELRFGDQPPVRFTLDATADATRAEAHAAMETEGRRALVLDARAPLEVGDSGMDFGLGEGPLTADVQLRQAPVAALLGPVPLVARPGGTLDGHLRASGTGPDDLQVDGELRLETVSLTLREPFVRLQEVDGRVAVDNEKVMIDELTTRDRDGKVVIDGSVGLSEWSPTRVDMRVRADEYPLRQEGIVQATLDGQVDVDGRLDTDPRELDVVLSKMAVKLPEQIRQSVQDLEQHPEVIYSDQPGFDRSLTVAEALAAHQGEQEPIEPAEGEPEPTPLIVKVRSPSPFWVRRSDFAVQLALDLTLHSEGTRTTLRGPVNVRRGFIDLLGKTFRFEEGSIDFGGAMPVDPVLELAATHELASGHTVTVNIGGTLGAPELSFSSSDPSLRTDTEVIAALMGVRGREDQGEQDAQSQTRSMLAGMMTGLVGTLTRKELGQYVPILALESGGTAQSTRLRAGFQADALIPKSWRDWVLGMYIEGSVGGGGESETSAGSGGPRAGFLIELFHPHDLSTTATYEQPDNWSLDLLWEP